MLGFGLFFAANLMAQNAEITDYPPNAEAGKCYAQCRVPAVYDWKSEQVLVTPEKKSLVKVPAKYEYKEFQVLVKAEYTVKKVTPATYKTESERVLVDEGSSVVRVTPAVYKTETEVIEVEPARTKWKKGKADSGCLSADPEDCKVWCLVEIPAVNKTIYKKVLVSPAKEEVVKGEPKYKMVYSKVVDKPASVSERTIPAVYKTERKKVLVSPATTREISAPPVYKTVKKKFLVSAEQIGAWKEILCNSKVNSQKIAQIQRALIAKGYDVGPSGVDNVIGADTKAAFKVSKR
ncbi:MAG: peptidoglycan-binding protein [Crocinitomicaceae bacterium]